MMNSLSKLVGEILHTWHSARRPGARRFISYVSWLDVEKLRQQRLSGAPLHRLLGVSVVFALACFLRALTCNAAEVKRDFVLDFSGYRGGSVDDWLRAKHFTFEKDAKNRRLLQLSVANDRLMLEAKGPLSGFLLNDAVNLENTAKIRINWGIIQYPVDVSYQRKINNEALMLYVFFGTEKISSGHVLIPNSPYFVGLFLCQDDQVDFPYRGRYFQAGGRFVCLGKPKPGETVVSEFDLDTAFKRYFDKKQTPAITGIGFGIDTSQAGRGGTAAAFVKSIEFVTKSARHGTKVS
jgi:hypothetical protein